MADAESLEAPARQEKARGGRGRKWLLGLAAALVLLLGGGLLLLNTPIGGLVARVIKGDVRKSVQNLARLR